MERIGGNNIDNVFMLNQNIFQTAIWKCLIESIAYPESKVGHFLATFEKILSMHPIFKSNERAGEMA